MNKYPKLNCRSHQIALFIHRSGGATKAQCVEAFSNLTPQNVRDAINQMVYSRMIEQDNGIYKVRLYMAQWLDESQQAEDHKSNIVQPRTAPSFKPLSAKYMLPKVPPRDDALPLREVSFKTGSVGFPMGYYA